MNSPVSLFSHDPHKKESANGNARWNANYFNCYNFCSYWPTLKDH